MRERCKWWESPTRAEMANAVARIEHRMHGVMSPTAPFPDPVIDRADLWVLLSCARRCEAIDAIGPDKVVEHYRERVNNHVAIDAADARALLDAASERDALAKRVRELETALARINVIRNSIVAIQGFNFSEHAYPLVAALNEVGIEGMPYPEALEYFGSMLERTNKAEAESTRLRAENERMAYEASTMQESLRLALTHGEAAQDRVRQLEVELQGGADFTPSK